MTPTLRSQSKFSSSDYYVSTPSRHFDSSSKFPSIPSKRKCRDDYGTYLSSRAIEEHTKAEARFRCASLSFRHGNDGASDEKKRTVSATTLPRIRVPSFFRRRPQLKTCDSDLSQKSGGSLRSPDRFVPSRRPTIESVIESFRVNKDPYTLSTEERLLRHKDASADAFNPRRSITSPTSRAIRPTPPLPRPDFSVNRSGGGGASHNFQMVNKWLIDLRSKCAYVPP